MAQGTRKSKEKKGTMKRGEKKCTRSRTFRQQRLRKDLLYGHIVLLAPRRGDPNCNSQQNERDDRIRTSEKNKNKNKMGARHVIALPRVEIVDLTRSQRDLLPGLAIDHL